jgi:hypothetical protein
MEKDIFTQIRDQIALSDGVIATLLPCIRDVYFPGMPTDHIQCGDMSSFARGTNNDLTPDLDLIFPGAPNDEARGYKDWTPIGTFELTGDQQGITSLGELGRLDGKGMEVVRCSQAAIDVHFDLLPGSTRFNWARSWQGFPGVVFNLLFDHPQFGEIAIDMNIVYDPSHFGVEHDKRFKAYFQRLVEQYGTQLAAKFVEDIRRVKQQAKDNARDLNGWIDRTKKLPGFLVEGLFAQKFPPYTYAELMEQILAHRWQPDRAPTDHKVGDQYNQIIDAGFTTLAELFENLACENQSFSLGAWENLLSIARKYPSSQQE